MTKNTCLLWFRSDLRIDDNSALSFALQNFDTVIPVYIHDQTIAGKPAAGAATLWWLQKSLSHLNDALENTLVFKQGDTETILKALCQENGISDVLWNKDYNPAQREYDERLKASLSENNIQAHDFNGALLYEPETVKSKTGTAYKVFTPFYKTCLERGTPPEPENIDTRLLNERLRNHPDIASDELQLYAPHTWHEKLKPHWTPGFKGAEDTLHHFLEASLHDYKDGRDYPSRARTSQLSPYLHFGEISPATIWHVTSAYAVQNQLEQQASAFLRQLVWREFSYHLLYQEPQMKVKPLQPKFQNFPWQDDPEKLEAWKRGLTGYPIIDAGMRELWETGYMHNRLRMLVGSFLVKNLLIHWHEGEKWFWDCLLDADHGNNSAGWQWIAGCGTDAAPYFRIFNPVTQSQRFDADGAYIRRWVAELKDLPNDLLHAPWEASDGELRMGGVILGETYPFPIIDLKQSRQRALDAYEELKNNAA